jgi:hypothetical protein
VKALFGNATPKRQVPDVTQIFGDDPDVIIAGLIDGELHSRCISCQATMRAARQLLVKLLKAPDDLNGDHHGEHR